MYDPAPVTLEDLPTPEARAAVRAFLAAHPSLTPAPPHGPDHKRAAQLEDAAHALHFMGQPHSRHSEAQQAACQALTFAAQVWAAFLEDACTPPAHMAARVQAWGVAQTMTAAAPLPAPLLGTLQDCFPRVGPWLALVTVTGCLTAKEAGACAAWQVAATLGTWCAQAGYEDGEAEDLCAVMLEGLAGQPPRVMN